MYVLVFGTYLNSPCNGGGRGYELCSLVCKLLNTILNKHLRYPKQFFQWYNATVTLEYMGIQLNLFITVIRFLSMYALSWILKKWLKLNRGFFQKESKYLQ